MRKPFIAGNWKMFKTNEEAVNLIQTIKAGVYKTNGVQIVVAPPFTALAAVAKIIQESPIELAAQNMYPESEGAFTGEISPLMLKELGCRYVILGHSERRQCFKETDAFINEKVKTALKYSIIPILCVGETLDEREARQEFEVIKKQLTGCLADLSKEDVQKTVIAYEPVWAIGTGKTATPEQAEQIHAYIRRLLSEQYGDIASKVSVLYGGSVKPDNISTLIGKENVDGALVGGASLKGEAFIQIVQKSIIEQEAGAN